MGASLGDRAFLTLKLFQRTVKTHTWIPGAGFKSIYAVIKEETPSEYKTTYPNKEAKVLRKDHVYPSVPIWYVRWLTGKRYVDTWLIPPGGSESVDPKNLLGKPIMDGQELYAFLESKAIKEFLLAGKLSEVMDYILYILIISILQVFALLFLGFLMWRHAPL